MALVKELGNAVEQISVLFFFAERIFVAQNGGLENYIINNCDFSLQWDYLKECFGHRVDCIFHTAWR